MRACRRAGDAAHCRGLDECAKRIAAVTNSNCRRAICANEFSRAIFCARKSLPLSHRDNRDSFTVRSESSVACHEFTRRLRDAHRGRAICRSSRFCKLRRESRACSRIDHANNSICAGDPNKEAYRDRIRWGRVSLQDGEADGRSDHSLRHWKGHRRGRAAAFAPRGCWWCSPCRSRRRIDVDSGSLLMLGCEPSWMALRSPRSSTKF